MHLSLKGSMDRQPLTDRLGDKLLAEYGGAAAAYSLRALNGNGDKVVRVRRASDNAEKDFTASQISTGEMTNWVNSQIVPPLDIGVETSDGRPSVPDGGTSIGTPAAAYSLRSLGEGQADDIVPSGDTVTPAAGAYVVQVRRSSDDAVKSFTASEVADGTLEDWVNTDYEVYSSDFSTTQFWTSPSSAVTITSEDGIGGLNGVLELDCSGSSGRFGAYKLTLGLETGEKHSVTFRYYTTDSSFAGKYWNAGNAFSNVNVVTSSTNDQIISDGTWREVTLAFNNENSGLRLKVSDTSGGAYGSLLTDLSGSIYIRDVVLTTTHANGYVRTWYDQSTSDNHATQTTNANQPKIVDAGSLVTGGIDFDGVDDGLLTSSNFTDTLQSATFFAVTKDDTTSGTASMVRIRPNGDYGAFEGITWQKGTDDTYARATFIDGANGAVSASAGGQGTRNTSKNLNTLIYQQSQILAYENGALDATLNTVSSGSVPVGDVTLVDQLWLGQNFDDNARPFNGTMSEVIIYFTDQSDNRTAIEANIGEHYGISGIPAYDNTVDGFVETWYDQSGNGNDATQTVAANQPKIVDGGTLLSNGIDFDGADDSLSLANVFTGTDGVSTFIVGNADTTAIGEPMFAQGDLSGALGSAYSVSSEIAFRVAGSAVFNDDFIDANPLLLSLITPDAGTTSDAVAHLNGTQLSQVSSSATTLDYTNQAARIGRRFASTAAYDGSLKELIIYDSDQSANRTAIEANINNQYSIY